AGGGPQDPGQAIEERALAGAVRADDRADLVALHGEVDPIQRTEPAEPDGQILGAQDRVCGVSPRPEGTERRIARWFDGHLGKGASRWRDRLFLGHYLQDPILAFVDVVDELAQEGLVVLLPQGLVALREVIPFPHFEAFQ